MGRLKSLKTLLLDLSTRLNKIDLLKISIGYVLENDRLRGEAADCPPFIFTLKKNTKTSDFQSNELHSIQSLYDHPFHKILNALGHNLTPLPRGSGVLFPP